MGETLSEQMLRENAGAFRGMVRHRFVEDIKHDALQREVFDRYLVYEGAFVETAISIFAYGVAKARTMAQRRRLVAVLDALANEQIAYFERTFTARAVDPAVFDVDIPEVENFRTGMLAIARDGAFLDIVAAMFAAEWMYWTWCAEAARFRISDSQISEWVALHAHEDFAAQAKWLKHEIDTAGDGLDPDERARLSRIFGDVQRLEIAFHHAPYR